jgi:hypothetical protein
MVSSGRLREPHYAVVAGRDKQQVPPLRFAPVGMTLLFECWSLLRRIREGRFQLDSILSISTVATRAGAFDWAHQRYSAWVGRVDHR